jgi:hypothetical protein
MVMSSAVLWRVQGNYGGTWVCAGIVVEDNVVVEAAPFFKWTVGLRWKWLVKSWLMNHGYTGEPIEESA